MDLQTSFDQLIDIHKWIQYAPGIRQYVVYPTNILFAGIKITDLYSVLCVARSNLYYSSLDNLGDITNNTQESKIYAKSIFVQNALMYYNIAVDHSWQYLWLFYNNTISDMLPTDMLYQSCLKDCSYDELILGLTLRRDIKMREIVKNFFSHNEYFIRMRPMYNYLKHRASYHFQGLGINPGRQPFSFYITDGKNSCFQPNIDNGMYIPCITYKELSIPEWTDLLLSFDHAFIGYFIYILQITMPYDYLKNQVEVYRIVDYYSQHWDEIVDYNAKL